MCLVEIIRDKYRKKSGKFFVPRGQKSGKLALADIPFSCAVSQAPVIFKTELDKTVYRGTADFRGFRHCIDRRFSVQNAPAPGQTRPQINAVVVIKNAFGSNGQNGTLVKIGKFDSGFVSSRRLVTAFGIDRFRKEAV